MSNPPSPLIPLPSDGRGTAKGLKRLPLVALPPMLGGEPNAPRKRARNSPCGTPIRHEHPFGVVQAVGPAFPGQGEAIPDGIRSRQSGVGRPVADASAQKGSAASRSIGIRRARRRHPGAAIHRGLERASINQQARLSAHHLGAAIAWRVARRGMAAAAPQRCGQAPSLSVVLDVQFPGTAGHDSQPLVLKRVNRTYSPANLPSPPPSVEARANRGDGTPFNHGSAGAPPYSPS